MCLNMVIIVRNETTDLSLKLNCISLFDTVDADTTFHTDSWGGEVLRGTKDRDDR